MKLLVKVVGVEKSRTGSSKPHDLYNTVTEEEDEDRVDGYA